MIECPFFDGEQPANNLPSWATITQVSDFLEIPRSAVRSTVRRAVANNEEWVKKETGEGKCTHYLIDTTHELYKSHETRWRQNLPAREEELAASASEWSGTGEAFHSQVPPMMSSITSSTLPTQDSYRRLSYPDTVLHRWTKFRQRLYSWGIQVFQNILAEEERVNPWQWRWGNLHGEGYSNEEEAIIAAIESHFTFSGEEEHEGPKPYDSSSQPGATNQVKPQRFKFFNKRNGEAFL